MNSAVWLRLEGPAPNTETRSQVALLPGERAPVPDEQLSQGENEEKRSKEQLHHGVAQQIVKLFAGKGCYRAPVPIGLPHREFNACVVLTIEFE